MRTIALLTGRGMNSLKDKNILDVEHHPVLYYPAKSAKLAKTVDAWFVSSEDEKILKIAGEMGYTQIHRPKELAQPDSKHIDALLHGLEVMKAQNLEPEILVVLLANNVTIKPEWIDDCVALLEADESLTAVIPVYMEMDHHPMRAKKMGEDGVLNTFLDMEGQEVSTNRQELEPCYYLSHNFWVLRVKSSIMKNDGDAPWSFMGKKVKGYLVEDSIDIHEKMDLLLAEDWVRQHWKYN